MTSNLRIFGCLLGLTGIIATFRYYRGVKWHRNSFALMFLASLSLLLISINPDLLNLARDILLFKDLEFGRILTLLLLATLFLVFFSFYLYGKFENIRHNTDRFFQSVSLQEAEQRTDFQKVLKPITILIPAYNEADNLRTLLPALPTHLAGLEVSLLVIDDGSTDETLQVLRELGVPYVRNIVNRGQGAASRLGYSILRNSAVRFGITMDADNQHRPEDLEKFIPPLRDEGYDLVVGSRRLGATRSVSRLRNLGVVVFSKAISLFLGVSLTDCSSGFKAFNRRWLDSVNLQEDQFQSTEVLITTIKKGLRVCEVPVIIEARAHGDSKKGSDLLYGTQVAKVLLKTWWRK